MNSQEYNLNIRPGVGIPPIVRVSQDDAGRPLAFKMYDGASALTIASGTTIEIHGTKRSGLGFTEACTWSGSTVSVDTTEAMTQESGAIPTELVFTSGTDVIASANFMLVIEPSPHSTAVTDGTVAEAINAVTRCETYAQAAEDAAADAASDAAEAAETAVNALIATIPADYTSLSTQVATNTADITEIKADLGAYNAYDILAPSATYTSRTVNGVTFTWNADNSECTATGTADGLAVTNLYSNSTALMDGIEPGGKYYVKYKTTDTKLCLNILFLDSNGETVLNKFFTSDASITVPDDAIGMTVRLRVLNGNTVSDAVASGIAFLTSVDNATLFDYFETPLNGWVGFYGAYPTFTVDGTTISVNIPANPRIYYNGGYKVLTTSAQTVDVAHASYLVINLTTNAFEVVTNTDITNNPYIYIICFYSSYGKIFGPWGIYANADRISTLEATDIPSYSVSMLDTAIAYTNAMDIGASFRFVFWTDLHIKRNSWTSPQMIKRIHKKCNMPIIMGGDIITEDDTQADALETISGFRDKMDSVWNDMYCIIGNHEYNNPDAGQSAEELAKMLTVNQIKSLLTDDKAYRYGSYEPTHGSYWIDDTGRKVRVFCLSCTYGGGLPLVTQEWVFDQLLTVPNGYKVIIVSHVGVTAGDGTTGEITSFSTPFQRILDACDAVNAGTTYQIASGYTEYDYSSLTDVEVVCCFIGHVHYDAVGYSTNGIPVIVTDCDKTVESGHSWRTAGTNTEQCFDIVTVDFDNRKVTAYRVGGYNTSNPLFDGQVRAIPFRTA